MPLIAITPEMGSLGIEVAAGLKLALIHREVIEHPANKMRVRKSHVQRLLDGDPAFAETRASQRRLAELKMAAVIKSALRERAPTRAVRGVDAVMPIEDWLRSRDDFKRG